MTEHVPSTATVHHDAPPSGTGGAAGRVLARFTPSVALTWEDSGTPQPPSFDAVSPSNGEEMSLELPHTDQPGFVDAAGNPVTDWYYKVRLWFFVDGQEYTFAPRVLRVPTGASDVDLGTIPFGNPATPAVESPSGTTLAGLTDVDLTGLADGVQLKWDAATSKWVTGAVAYRSVTDFNSGTGTTATCDIPPGTAVGDLLVFFVWNAGGPDAGPPYHVTGWVQVASIASYDGGGNYDQYLTVWIRRAQLADLDENIITFPLGNDPTNWYTIATAISGYTRISGVEPMASGADTKLIYTALPAIQTGDVLLLFAGARIGNQELAINGMTTLKSKTNDPNVSLVLARTTVTATNTEFGSPPDGAHTSGFDLATGWVGANIAIS